VVDELTQVGVQRRDAALFVVLAVFRFFEFSRHRRAERGQVRDIVGIGRAERRRSQAAKHSAETTFEQWRRLGRQQAPDRRAMPDAHEQPPSRTMRFSCEGGLRKKRAETGGDKREHTRVAV
jgi:hypothetical protein